MGRESWRNAERDLGVTSDSGSHRRRSGGHSNAAAERARMAAGRAQVLLIFTVVWSNAVSALPLTAAVGGKVGSLRSDGTPGALTIPPYRMQILALPRRAATRRAAPRPPRLTLSFELPRPKPNSGTR